MDFLEAVKALKEGKCVGIKLIRWNDSLYLQMSGGNIVVHWSDGTTGPWSHPLNEIMDDTWELVHRPKVKKKVEGWVNVLVGYPYPSTGYVWETKEKAISAREGRPTDYYGEPLFISHEYEVEE